MLTVLEEPPCPAELQFRRREAGLQARVVAEALGIGEDTLRWAEEGSLTTGNEFRQLWTRTVARLAEEVEATQERETGAAVLVVVTGILGLIAAAGLAGVFIG